jgi:hypothetical protein
MFEKAISRQMKDGIERMSDAPVSFALDFAILSDQLEEPRVLVMASMKMPNSQNKWAQNPVPGFWAKLRMINTILKARYHRQECIVP